MEGVRSRTLKVRGIVHCHTDFSYDCMVSLTDLCAALREEGFSFVALTEHAEGVTRQSYQRFVDACRRHSTGSFVVIPGLEIRCDRGFEIAGVGIPEVVDFGTADQVVARVRELGGYAIWVHPRKHDNWPGRILDCDALEVLNAKVDGTVAPSFTLLRRLKKHRGTEARTHAIFGIDLHDLDQPRDVWIECEAPELTSRKIVQALREGNFVSRVVNGGVSSSGEIPFAQRLLLVALRFAYLGWNGFRRALPGRMQTGFTKLSRPIIRVIKAKGDRKREIGCHSLGKR